MPPPSRKEHEPFRLEIFLPTKKIVDAEVRSVQAEDDSGSFGIRPGFEPFCTALNLGLLHYVDASGGARWLAVEEGLLLTDGKRVEVYTRDAHPGDSAEEVRRLLEEEFARQRETEREKRNAMLRMQLAAFKMLFGYEQ